MNNVLVSLRWSCALICQTHCTASHLRRLVFRHWIFQCSSRIL